MAAGRDMIESHYWLQNALTLLESGRAFVVATIVVPNGPLAGRHIILDSIEQPIPPNDDLTVVDRERWVKVVKAVYATRSASLEPFQIGGKTDSKAPVETPVFVTYCGPSPQAWIFGAGHIAQALAPMLGPLGWNIIICDDRAEFASATRFPDVSECRVGPFVESAGDCALQSDVWAILVTRGHQHDVAILKTLAQTDRPSELRYVGMIGSKRRVGNVQRQLREQGISPSFLEKIHAPIGLPIGADSPHEIAVSIAAEMIALRSGRQWNQTTDTLRQPPHDWPHPVESRGRLELWRQALREVKAGNKVILATIIARRGSTPRGPGTQMLIFGNGSFTGTIGGGCGEGAVLHKAREMLLRNEKTGVLDLDLTGTDPSDCADVCGGFYKVFMESIA